jgi:VWFA-related protein
VKTIRSGRLFAIALSCILPTVPVRLAAQNTQHGPTIRVQVDSVFIPVIVRDAKGHAANDLARDDFQIFDNGKLTSISGFAIEKRAELYSRKAVESPKAAPNASNQPPAVQAATPVPTRFIVFVFDNLHLSFGELMRVQKAASKIFGETMTETDMAAVVSLSGTNSGLTHDMAQLQETVNEIRVQQVFSRLLKIQLSLAADSAFHVL